MSIVKHYKCDFCGVKVNSADLVYEAIEMHCCYDCDEVIKTVLAEVANYTMPRGKVPQDKVEFADMMHTLYSSAESNK